MTSPTTTEVSTERPPARLGVAAIVFLIIAASAPLTVIAGGSTSAFSVTHVLGVPFGFLVLAVALGVFAIGYSAMSRFITNAGAFYAYVAQGIGRPAGVGAAILAFISYNAMQVGIWGMFGFQVSEFVAAKTGATIPWWIWVLVGIAAVGLMGANRIDLSVKVVAVLVAAEFLVVIVFDLVAFANPTEGFSADPITPSALFVPGVGAVLAFGVAAFMGFESGAIYSEEARDARRTVPRATFLAVAVIGLFYAVSSWALALAVGPDTITSPDGIAPEDAGPPLFFNFVAQHLGEIGVDLMSVLFITSLLAALISFHNAVARYAFSLGREGVLPKQLAVLRNGGAPWAGSLLQTIIAAVIVLGFVLVEPAWDVDQGPYPVITLFTWLTNLGAFGLVLLMAVASVAVIGYFRRDPRDVGVGSRVVAPVIGCIALLVIWVLILLNWDVLLGQPAGAPVTWVLPAIVLVPSLLAVGWGFWMRTARPDVYRRIGHGAEGPSAHHLGEVAEGETTTLSL
ncbi:MAG TPA: amino acid permease [Micrococcales bacterium]|uniref:APC family permease n=1 Tax=Miniimonas arenae TaxID=676201 RepID=UPI000EE0EF38|nr:APC family permease [Miniimonas arenae]HCX84882.1 amino acid permease [Micrococcales bacterium]